MDDLRFYILFNSFSDTGQWVGFNEMLCAVGSSLQLKGSAPQARGPGCSIGKALAY